MTTSTTRNGNGCTSNIAGPWKHPELDSPGQRAKWEQSKPYIHLKFLGEPAPQGSKVVSKWGSLREVSAKIQPWRASVQYACEKQYHGQPISDPVELDVTFLLPRPKGDFSTAKGREHEVKPSSPVHHTKTPDLDKLLRGLLDPMTVKCGGNVLMDDSCVIALNGRKRYAEANESVGALVSIRIVR